MNCLNSLKRLALLALLLGVSAPAFATGEIRDAFLAHYKAKEEGPLGQKSCSLCHTSDEEYTFNAYGKDVKEALKAQGGGDVPTDATFASLDAKDSDSDGATNGEEIAAETLPGDAKSGAKAGAKPAAAKEEKPPVPKNAFHPAIVHFPIALFVAGLVLDFFGMIRQDKTLLQAGWYNIVFAAVTALGGILSGVAAMALMKMPYKGLIFEHLSLATLSTIIMWILVAMRVHRHEKMSVPLRAIYYILAAAALVIISYAGHLGGVFVYGE